VESPHRHRVTIETKRLWTLRLRGGEPFQVQAPGNLILDHDGSDTIHTLLMTDPEVQQVVAWIGKRAHIDMSRSAQETPEQDHERKVLAGKVPLVLPTPNCPTCIFFDPLSAEHCGVVDWHGEMVLAVVQQHTAKVKEDLKACPLKRTPAPPQ